MAGRRNGLGKGLGKGLDALIPDKINGNVSRETSVKKRENKRDALEAEKIKKDVSRETSTKSKIQTKKNPSVAKRKKAAPDDVTGQLSLHVEQNLDGNTDLTDDINKNSQSYDEMQSREYVLVNINDVEPNRDQPRKDFDEDALIELSESVRQFGVLQPLLVQKRENYYEIIAGERRWRAARMAGLKEIPVIIKDFSSQEILEISLIENIQRENLNPIEEAIAFKRLLDEFHLKQDEVAERVSKSRTAVTNSMRLLRLDEKVQKMIIDDMITTGHARALLAVEDKKLQQTLALRIFDEKLSVRDIEKIVKDLKKEKKQPAKKEIKNQFIYTDIEEKLKSVIGTKVTVNCRSDQKGRIEIEYYSQEELTRIYDMLLSAAGN